MTSCRVIQTVLEFFGQTKYMERAPSSYIFMKEKIPFDVNLVTCIFLYEYACVPGTCVASFFCLLNSVYNKNK